MLPSFMNAILLFCELMTTRGRSALATSSPVLRLLRTDSTRDQLPLRPLAALTASRERSNGKLKPIIGCLFRTASQKIRLMKEDRVINPIVIRAGKHSIEGTFFLLFLYLLR